MYRFRYLLGLQHSKCTRVAWRVGWKWPISYYVSDNEHHSYSFWKSKSFYRLMLVDHSKEAENDQLSDGYSLDAPSGALRAPLLHSLTWSWKICVKVTPKPSSRTTLSHGVWSVITLRCWHQHQRLEKIVSFSEMYRFRCLLGLEHSQSPRAASRVGQNCLFFICRRCIDLFFVSAVLCWVFIVWGSSTTRWKRTTISFPMVIVSMHLVGRFAPNSFSLWLGVGRQVSKWPQFRRVEPIFRMGFGLWSLWGVGINTRG